MIANDPSYKYSKSETLPPLRQSFVIHTESRVWVVDASDIEKDGVSGGGGGSFPHAVMVGRISRYDKGGGSTTR